MADQQQYDVVIIGSGPGGYVAGIRAGQTPPGVEGCAAVRDGRGAPESPRAGSPPDKGQGEDEAKAVVEERKSGGLGMAFVRALTDSIEYQRVAGRNRLVLRRRARGTSPPPA